jgi:ABC-2 type transport system permease protein
MSKLWLVARYEYVKAVKRRSFLFATLGVPFLIIVMVGVVSMLNSRTGAEGQVGYVDGSGVLASVPAPPADQTTTATGEPVFRPYSDRATAEAALKAGEVQAVYILGADYLETGKVDLLYDKRAPSDRVESAFVALIRPQLVAGVSPEMQERALSGPGGLVFETTTGRVETATGGLLRLIFPAAVALFFVVAVMASAGYLLQAVTEEKENRTMEIMTTSLSAEQLVVGKSVGLIAVSLTQVVIWLLVGALALAAAAQAIPVLKDVQVPWGFVGIAVLFFLPSFVLEAGIITSVGAAVTDLRQGQQITGVLQLFFWLPFFFIGLIIGSPDNPVLVALSLFPLTSLSTIALRWGATVIPWWQIVVAWLLVAGSAVGMLLVAPRIFRRGMLRYGQHMKLGGLMEAVRSRNA